MTTKDETQVEDLEPSRAWIEPFARFGYFVRGVIYLVIGVLCVMTAVGQGDHAGPSKALAEIFSQPLGGTLLFIVTIGLACYAIWRFVQSLADTDDHGWSARGLIVRAGLIMSGAAYGLLFFDASRLLWTSTFSSGSGETKGFLLGLLAGAVGPLLLATVLALIFATVSAAHFWKAFTFKYADHFPDEAPMWLVHTLSVIGLAARGLIFAVVAYILWRRVFSSGTPDASIPSTEDALQFVDAVSPGTFTISLIGVGLLAFAAYSFSLAIWRRLRL